MKTIHSNSYAYLGVVDNWHVFKYIKSNSNKELLFEECARYVRADGSSIFYDPIIIEKPTNEDRMDRLLSYSRAISGKSASVKPRSKVGRIPKRSGADDEASVINEG